MILVYSNILENGISFEVDDSIHQEYMADHQAVEKKTRARNMDYFNGAHIGSSSTLEPVKDDDLVEDDPLLGSFEDLGKHFKNVTEDGGVKKRVRSIVNSQEVKFDLKLMSYAVKKFYVRY